jgi:hypothetical protein
MTLRNLRVDHSRRFPGRRVRRPRSNEQRTSERSTLRVIAPGSQVVPAVTANREIEVEDDRRRRAHDSPERADLTEGHDLRGRQTVAVAPWHFLYFLPDPHGQGSFRPTFG